MRFNCRTYGLHSTFYKWFDKPSARNREKGSSRCLNSSDSRRKGVRRGPLRGEEGQDILQDGDDPPEHGGSPGWPRRPTAQVEMMGGGSSSWEE